MAKGSEHAQQAHPIKAIPSDVALRAVHHGGFSRASALQSGGKPDGSDMDGAGTESPFRTWCSELSTNPQASPEPKTGAKRPISQVR